VALKFAKNPKAKLSLLLSFLSKYIHECIEGDKSLLKKEFTAPKALLFQMYFVINKLDEQRFARMDFLVNFGVSLSEIRVIAQALEEGGTYEEFKEGSLKRLPFSAVLKIHKYFFWADKKLHQVFYIENKDEISEDLLSDFKDPENEAKFRQPKTLGKVPQKEPEKQVIVKQEKMISEHEYLFGKKSEESKIIDVKSNQDFPTLANEGGSSLSGVAWSAPGKSAKTFQKSYGKKA